MGEQNNPAGRLYAILTVARQTEGGKRTSEAWAKALGVEEKNAGALHEALANVLRLAIRKTT